MKLVCLIITQICILQHFNKRLRVQKKPDDVTTDQSQLK